MPSVTIKGGEITIEDRTRIVVDTVTTAEDAEDRILTLTTVDEAADRTKTTLINNAEINKEDQDGENLQAEIRITQKIADEERLATDHNDRPNDGLQQAHSTYMGMARREFPLPKSNMKKSCNSLQPEARQPAP